MQGRKISPILTTRIIFHAAVDPLPAQRRWRLGLDSSNRHSTVLFQI